MMNQSPVVQSLLVCEQLVVEARTGNMTLVNCFTRRVVRRFPTEELPFVVFAVLTNGFGEMPLEILIHRLDNYEEIYRFSQKVRFSSPLQAVRCVLHTRSCSFPVAGEYQVSLVVGQDSIAQCKILVLEQTK
jgi:hypothetical protein